MSQIITPRFAEHTLPVLDAGVFEEKLNRAMRDVAFAVVTNDDNRKKGKVTIELTFERINETEQINLGHKVVWEMPTAKGKRIEHNDTSTALFVNRSGTMTITPEAQLSFDAFKTTRETIQ